MRVLMTGPGGFLGSALAHHWARCGHELTLLARPGSRLQRLNGLLPSVRVVRASLPEEIDLAVREAGPDVIVHTACSYGRKGETPLDVMSANLVLGAELLQAVLDYSKNRLGPVSFLNTGTVLSADVSLYALSKTQFSSWGAALSSQFPEILRFIDIKLQHMYGPDDDRSKFTTHVIKACIRNDSRLELTSGEQKRDFIHIEDAVRAYDCILNHHASFEASDSIEVGSGEAVAIRDFVELVKRTARASTELEFGAIPHRPKEPMLCVADTKRLHSLGWRAKVSLNEGLAQMLGATRSLL